MKHHLRDIKPCALMAAHAIADGRDHPGDWKALSFCPRVFHRVCTDWFPSSLPAFLAGDVWAQLSAGAEMLDRCTRRELRESFQRVEA